MSSSFTAITADGRHSDAPATSSAVNSDVDEEEVDQLDSGLDDDEDDDGMEPEAEEEAGTSVTKGRRKLGLRLPGHTLIPQDRLENILQAEGAGQHMSKEAVYMLSIATEEFVKKLAEAGYAQTLSENRQHVQYRDMANVTHRRSEFSFLDDTVPKPMSISEAMQLRAAKERESLEDDPAISAAAPSSPPFGPSQPGGANANAKGRFKGRASLPNMPGRDSNGLAAPSASASAQAMAARSRQRDGRGRWSNTASNGSHSHEGTPSSTATAPPAAATTATRRGTRAVSARIRNQSARAREAAEAAQAHTHRRGSHSQANGVPAANGHAHGTAPHPGPSEPAGQPESWPPSGQTIGPASGYMDPNGRSPMTDNPGRTIYSQRPVPQF